MLHGRPLGDHQARRRTAMGSASKMVDVNVPASSPFLIRTWDPAMDTTPVYWHCPRCGLADGWDVAPAHRRVWVEASCPACDGDYRVLVTQPVVGTPHCLVVHSAHGVVH